MDDRNRARIIKQTRRAILDALKQVYDLPLTFESLCEVLLYLNVADEDVAKDVAYLIDKGYVRWVNQAERPPWKRRLYTLTAAGVETADKINRDPALEP